MEEYLNHWRHSKRNEEWSEDKIKNTVQAALDGDMTSLIQLVKRSHEVGRLDEFDDSLGEEL